MFHLGVFHNAEFGEDVLSGVDPDARMTQNGTVPMLANPTIITGLLNINSNLHRQSLVFSGVNAEQIWQPTVSSPEAETRQPSQVSLPMASAANFNIGRVCCQGDSSADDGIITRRQPQ